MDNESSSSSLKITLKHDTHENTGTEEQQMTMKCLYWAAFIGNKAIVEAIIRLGYSPFLASEKKKNAVIGAVEGG